MNKFITFLCMMLFSGYVMADQELTSVMIKEAPLVDGVEDKLWAQVKGVKTYDKIAGIDIEVKSVYSEDEIYFHVKFPGDTESREHKTLEWNAGLELYQVGYQREDVFVIKWNMDSIEKDISLNSAEPYKADIWYWKAHRTDPVGYADDKYQIYSNIKMSNAQSLVNDQGDIFYLARYADAGESSYVSKMQSEYVSESVLGFDLRQPTGSRADVKAKGVWQDGYWTIEFSRRLNTGYDDDVSLNIDRSYYFGVSRFEIAGRQTNDKLEQPLFGSGDITEIITLTFAK